MFGVKKQLGPRQVKTELLIYPFAYKPLAQGSFFQSKNEILSRFEGLKGISRDGLVKLVDVTRGSQGNSSCVSSYVECELKDGKKDGSILSWNDQRTDSSRFLKLCNVVAFLSCLHQTLILLHQSRTSIAKH